MAKRKMTTDEHGSSSEDHSTATDNGSSVGGNKMEAVRRALGTLGKKAKPAEIREHILKEFKIDMKPNMISAYKSMLAKKKGKRGRPGRKPRAETESADTGSRAAGGASLSSRDVFKDLRTLKELTDRLGPNRIRELLELMGH